MTPHKSPNLYTKRLNADFYVIVNSWHPSSLRVVNQRQLALLDQVDGVRTVDCLAGLNSLDSKDLGAMLDYFHKGQIIRYDTNFTGPELPGEPTTLNLWIHTTNKCNLACNYCYISTLNTTGGMQQEVKEKLIKKLVETAESRHLKQIKLRLAGGEPLTQFNNWKPFITEAKAAFKDSSCDFGVSFLTNLTILNQDIIDFSIKHDIQFGVSIDGFDYYNDLTRKFHNGRGSFDIIDKNIDLLIKNNIKVSVSSVVTQANMPGLPALTEYLIDKGIYFRYSIVKGEPIDRVALDKYLGHSYDIMEREVLNGWRFSQYHQLCDLKPSELGFQTCSSGFSGGALYVDGGIYYCHVQFGSKLGLSGTVFEEKRDLIEIIRSGSYNEGLKSADCTNCNYRHVCTSGCPMYRESGKDPNCSLYHKFIPRIYELQGKEKLKLILDSRNARNT